MSRTPSSVSVRPTRSNSSFVQSNSQSSHSSSPSTESYRHLNFMASLPIQFTFDNDGQDTSSSSSTYYLQVPRFNYLPLLIPVLKKQFLNENDDDIERQRLGGRSELGSKSSREIEFRDQKTKKLLKPHWPIGLLYDFHHSTNHHSLPPPSAPSAPTTTVVPPESLAAVFAPFDSPSLLSPPNSTLKRRVPPPSESRSVSGTTTSSSSASSSSTTTTTTNNFNHQSTPTSTTRMSLNPWKISIHFINNNTTTSSTSTDDEIIQECKNQFMNRLKESDYSRYGNFKKRLVGLRKEEQDGLWQSILQNDFTKFWTVGNKLFPLPSSTISQESYNNNNNNNDDHEATTNSNGSDGDLKNLAIKIYLPIEEEPQGGGGVRVLNSPTTPFDPKTGLPITLGDYLSTLLPLLFPAPGAGKAVAIIQGIVVPFESELNWLCSSMGGLDGWLNIVIAVRGE